jgi:hypothetical protein
MLLPERPASLVEIGLPVLMGRIFSDGTTGRLRIWYESVEKSVYFEAGLPVMAASNDVADRMLAMLVRERAVSAHQREEVEKVVDASGRKVGGVLVDLGFCAATSCCQQCAATTKASSSRCLAGAPGALADRARD